MKTKGLLVNVYRWTLGDCTADGISSKKDSLILVGEGIPEIFEGDETNTVKLVRRNLYSGEYLHVEPIEQPAGMNGPQFGGSFVYSSDSRFPSDYPIGIHDRFENWH